jgi:hypothetical protein
MKALLFIAASVLLAGQAHAAGKAATKKVMCMESGQDAVVIEADYLKGRSEAEASSVTITEHRGDGRAEKTVIKGVSPELNITEGRTNDGLPVVIIQSMIPSDKDTLEMRVLFCF